MGNDSSLPKTAGPQVPIAEKAAEHTQRRWKIDARPFNKYGLLHISCGDYIVAHALGQTSSCETEALAHARLIVRACNAHDDLVAALQDMVSDSDDVDDGKLPRIAAATLARARQILAKATQADEAAKDRAQSPAPQSISKEDR